MIDNYNALTLGQYMRVNEVLESPGEDLDKQVEIISILSGIPLSEVLLLPLADYSSMAAKTAFLREPCHPTEIKEDWTYGYLVPTLDFRKINTAQYIDFQTFSKDFPKSLPQLLSVFLVPEGKAYNDGYDIAEVQKVVDTMPLPDALGLAAFFFVRFVTLTADSLTSWASDLKKTKDETKKKEIGERIKMVETLLGTVGDGLRMLTGPAN